MILPIYLYNHPILKTKGIEVDPLENSTKTLVADMFDTMYQAQGVGLAAQQVGKALRVFVVDASYFYAKAADGPIERLDPPLLVDLQKKYKKAFINPKITQVQGNAPYEEGCLSIPSVYAQVIRPTSIALSYYDETGHYHEGEVFEGMMARVILHEYDHIQGVLFLDHLPSLRRELLHKKLEKIRKGLCEVDYPVVKAE